MWHRLWKQTWDPLSMSPHHPMFAEALKFRVTKYNTKTVLILRTQGPHETTPILARLKRLILL